MTCGPVFFNKSPAMWLEQDGEKKVAIPDALFKIVIKEISENTVDTLAFIIPNVLPKSGKNLNQFLASIDSIEELTGLGFLTNFDDEIEKEVERVVKESIDY